MAPCGVNYWRDMGQHWSSRSCLYRRAAGPFERPGRVSYVLMLLAMPFVHAQTFEVASIRASANGSGREGATRSRIEHTPTSLSMMNVTLADCVQWAYGVESFQISGAHL